MSRVAVIGAGAMGSVYAGLLAAAGHDVWAIDLWEAHVEAIRRHGLRVSGASGERVVRVSATTRAADAGVCDLVVIATKAMDVEAAALSARPLVGRDTVVLTIQNGLGSADRVARVLEPSPVAVGVAGGFGASIRAPGHVHHNGWELIRLGEREGPVNPRLRAVADLWSAAGFRVKTYDDVAPMVWEKLVCNVAYSGVCCLTGLTIGEAIADPDAWRVASGCAAEAFAVARARGIGVAIDDPVDYVRRFGLTIPGARPSMLLDHMARRRSEIDAINGAIPREAEAVGLRAPYNEVVSALVREREGRFGRSAALDEVSRGSRQP